MCILAISISANPDYPIIICSNRDEFMTRPTSQLQFWQDFPILASRDLVNKGLQLGINKDTLDFSSVLNYDENQIEQSQFQSVSSFSQESKQQEQTQVSNNEQPQLESLLVQQNVFLTRGDLPLNYLITQNKQEFEQFIVKYREKFKNYNLVFGNILSQEFSYFNNVNAPSIIRLQQGVHVVSNNYLNCQWYKCRHLKELFEEAVLKNNDCNPQKFFQILSNVEVDQNEEIQSSIFVPVYQLENLLKERQVELVGTSSQTVIIFEKKTQTVHYFERRYDVDQQKFTEYNFSLEVNNKVNKVEQ